VAIIHPHLESFATKGIQVDGGILGEISAQVVSHFLTSFLYQNLESKNDMKFDVKSLVD